MLFKTLVTLSSLLLVFFAKAYYDLQQKIVMQDHALKVLTEHIEKLTGLQNPQLTPVPFPPEAAFFPNWEGSVELVAKVAICATVIYGGGTSYFGASTSLPKGTLTIGPDVGSDPGMATYVTNSLIKSANVADPTGVIAGGFTVALMQQALHTVMLTDHVSTGVRTLSESADLVEASKDLRAYAAEIIEDTKQLDQMTTATIKELLESSKKATRSLLALWEALRLRNLTLKQMASGLGLTNE